MIQRLKSENRQQRQIGSRTTSTLSSNFKVASRPIARSIVQNISYVRKRFAASSALHTRRESSPLSKAEELCKEIVRSEQIPKEDRILAALAACQEAAQQLINLHGSPSSHKLNSAASALLDVEKSKKGPASKDDGVAVGRTVELLSSLAHSVVLSPLVFISPRILEQYVELHYLLERPGTLPEVFRLFAHKPVPEEGSSPVKFLPSKPDQAASAIPLHIADRALQTAIDAKQLDVAMNIVGTSYATKAARRAKFIRKALLPVTGLAAAPLAAYVLATKFGLYQTSMEPQTATNMAFVGILAYVGFTTTIGVVAVTTANDQMDRVTWATGMPLRERWLREEERAAIDRIAGSWGFRQMWRRGEEEGQDWAELREWIGRKGMILDRSELMEGME